MLQGPSLDLYKKILSEVKGIRLIASGGVHNVEDLEKLKEAGCEGAILGKAIYENRIPLKELEKFNNTN
jgi:phosphoribosylformimino-5-aminoimidazole carboxamide ribotide isomerase